MLVDPPALNWRFSLLQIFRDVGWLFRDFRLSGRILYLWVVVLIRLGVAYYLYVFVHQLEFDHARTEPLNKCSEPLQKLRLRQCACKPVKAPNN